MSPVMEMVRHVTQYINAALVAGDERATRACQEVIDPTAGDNYKNITLPEYGGLSLSVPHRNPYEFILIVRMGPASSGADQYVVTLSRNLERVERKSAAGRVELRPLAPDEAARVIQYITDGLH